MSGWHPVMFTPSPSEYRIKMLVYGPPGIGKTTLAGTASTCEAMAPVLIISAEAGEMSISEDIPGLIDTSKISITRFTTLGELERLFEWLATEDHGFKTVVLDSISELEVQTVQAWQAVLNPKEEGIPNLEKDKQMGFKIFGRATDTLRTHLRKFRDLPMHVIFTAHEKIPGDGDAVTPQRPSLMPKFCESVIGYVDILGYMKVVFPKVTEGEESTEEPQGVRVLLVQPTDSRRAKDRSPGGKLGVGVREPTMAKIWDRLATTKEIENDNDKTADGRSEGASRKRSAVRQEQG